MEDSVFKEIFPFDKARPLQREIIEQTISAFENGKRHVIISAPTGIGKSVIAYAVANYFERDGGSSYILTSQKILQEQYSTDLHVPSIKGRSNYICKRDPSGEITCHFGICSLQNRKTKCVDCPYLIARNIAFNSPKMVTNYSYFLNMGRAEAEMMTVRELLINDECHGAERELIEWSALNLNKIEFIKYGLTKAFLTFPNVNSSDEQKFDWLFDVVGPKMSETLEHSKNTLDSIESTDSQYISLLKLCSYLDTTVCTIGRLAEELNRGVHSVVDQQDDCITFKLVFGGPMADRRLFKYGEKILSMSATILSKSQYCRNMNINENDAEWIECPAVFKRENRLVHVCDVGSMSWKNKKMTMPKLVKSIKRLLEDHINERGIIHTVNYELTDYICEHIGDAFRDRLIVPRGKNRDELLKMFKESKRDDLVLISPSLTEGVDLKDDLSRFTVIAKVPWASLGDKWVKRRIDLDPEWYKENAIITMIQMTGRSVRSETDFAAGYILDSDFSFLFKTSMKKFPKWWKEALVEK